jgi:hypothetical protein
MRIAHPACGAYTWRLLIELTDPCTALVVLSCFLLIHPYVGCELKYLKMLPRQRGRFVLKFCYLIGG